LEKLVPYLDGLILTDAYSEGNHYSSSALEKLRQVLTPGKIRIPAAIFGGQALAEEWASLSGVAPVYSAEPTPNETLPTVKALLKSLLRSQMRSHPPPPPES
jgi:hypothetical protein